MLNSVRVRTFKSVNMRIKKVCGFVSSSLSVVVKFTRVQSPAPPGIIIEMGRLVVIKHLMKAGSSSSPHSATLLTVRPVIRTDFKFVPLYDISRIGDSCLGEIRNTPVCVLTFKSSKF